MLWKLFHFNPSFSNHILRKEELRDANMAHTSYMEFISVFIVFYSSVQLLKHKQNRGNCYFTRFASFLYFSSVICMYICFRLANWYYLYNIMHTSTLRKI